MCMDVVTFRSIRRQASVVLIGLGCLLTLYYALNATAHTTPHLPKAVAREYIEYWLHEARGQVAGNARLRHVEQLETLYRDNQFQLIWIQNYQLSAAGKALLQALKETASDHWRTYQFRVSKLENEIHRLANLPKKATAIDVLLTDAYISFAFQVGNRLLLPDTEELSHPSIKKVKARYGIKTPYGITKHLHETIQLNNLEALVQSMVPQQPSYKALSQELDRYTHLAESGEWFPLPPSRPLELGDEDANLPIVRWMLMRYGDYPEGQYTWNTNRGREGFNPYVAARQYRVGLNEAVYQFDEALLKAIQRFQRRNKLPITGKVDELTRTHLNMPPHQIAKRIALNLKRWRYLPDDLGDRYVLVNMADFRLDYIEQGRSVLDMNVVIGNKYRKTPVMTDTISSIVLAPTWNVPYSIATSSIARSAKKNPNYLIDKKFTLVQGWEQPKLLPLDALDWRRFRGANPQRLIQLPGEDNALGTIKFVFPNDFSIYLHDTSEPELFDKSVRAFSSGCVRVSKPKQLALALLKHQPGWDLPQIESYISRYETKHIAIKEPVPVYLMYWTAWVDNEGRLQLRDDVYSRDKVDASSSELDSMVL
jgi:murein L,D-transpeptidase YcbB/YkuD